MKFIWKYKKMIILLLIILIYIGYRLTLNPEERYERYVEKAHKSLMAMNISGVIRNLKEAVKYKPDSYEALHDLGFWLEYKGKYDEARKYFEQLIKYHGNEKLPGVANAYYYLGKMALKEDNKERAKLYFEKVIDIDPTYGKAYASLALCYEGEKRVEIYKKGIKSDPNEASNYIQLCLFYSDKYDLSVISFEELKKLIPLENATGEVLSRIGNLLYAFSGNIDTAMIVHEKALEKDDTLSLSYGDLGGIYKRKGLYKKAEISYKNAIRYDNRAENYNGLAHLYYILGEYEKTIETLLECIYYDKIDRYLMTMAYYKLGDYENALYWLKQYDSSDEEVIELRKIIEGKLSEQNKN
ncbi:hypothetical protein BBF96_12185 [Anoxybacter fermentans]|uniref:UDP-N-acetylglucosamine--peptide N-acetylglucosaminyltransferase SPINDLY n=1 Tax=Anoxybacter fermentans TaxID=1323375 RepID=A0A3Q9HRF9_9FIRM|nr:tetratricopeptide repeat protein [Anoxybacter fermentans]AZR74088.1 hypothetical protein BBF96_12185 [Anoxybacter fermentans]